MICPDGHDMIKTQECIDPDNGQSRSVPMHVPVTVTVLDLHGVVSGKWCSLKTR